MTVRAGRYLPVRQDALRYESRPDQGQQRAGNDVHENDAGSARATSMQGGQTAEEFVSGINQQNTYTGH